MCMALRKNDGIARSQTYWRFVSKLDVALAFRDQMENHHTLGTGLEQRRSRICAGGLVAPGCRKPRVDEDGADQSYDAKRLRQRIHYAVSASICKATGTASRTAADTGEQRLQSSTKVRNRSSETPCAEILTSNRTSRGAAPTDSPEASAIPNRPRVSERLLANTSNIASSIPAAAAPIAMRVAQHDARPARNSQPGVTWSPLPPSSVGMSVNIWVPFAWLATTRMPVCQRAVAGASS